MSIDYIKIIGGQKNLAEFYSKLYGATKKKILGCIFAEKLVLENVLLR